SAANLTGLVGVASAIANTTEGSALLGQLAQGNKTVFAPDNAAFAAVPSDVSSNTTLLAQILSYHILNNTYTVNGTLIAPDHTIARTLLTGGGYTLPGNRSAPVVLSRNSTNATSFQINQATSNVSTTGPAVAANLNVYIIDSVLSLPPNISAAATAIVPSLAQLIQSADLLDPLAASQGITVFAPNDAAVDAISGAVSSLNSTVIAGVLANHVINGSVVYSTQLTSSNYTSAGGEPFSFTSNSSGTYVTSANSTAKIVQSDIIIQNGVVH
ncbi:FAS1 domain-containing protein, partial [Naematelia encephala]